jgi:ElaB/YqjD/DUF883 family membrane-anchored ribosome-binding protein
MNLQLRTDADPAVIERDINQTRARVDEVLQALQVKLSPTELRAQATRFVKERGARLASRVEDRVRENPWPYMAGVFTAVAMITLLRQRRSGRAPDLVPRLPQRR